MTKIDFEKKYVQAVAMQPRNIFVQIVVKN